VRVRRSLSADERVLRALDLETWSLDSSLAPLPPAGQHVFEVRGLVVRREYRRMGVGGALLDAVARDASARGGRRLTLRVLAGNVPARGLYERYGFKVEGVLQEEFRLGGRYVDDVLMALALTGSRAPRSP
jgi:ribosomal protein S18 acetylase RimI-like enzyme